MNTKLAIATATILTLTMTNLNATPIHVNGDFSFTTKTSGQSFSGSFEGNILDAWIPERGSAFFQKRHFAWVDAVLSPQMIGDTAFDVSNLEISLHFMDGEFYQLWFGGDWLGANGIGGVNEETGETPDDFFVQWYRQLGSPPSTGSIRSATENGQVSIDAGNLTITVPEPIGCNFGMLVMIFLAIRRRVRR